MAGIFAALISFTLFVLVHWAVCHRWRWRPLARVLNGLWLGNLLVYAALFYFVATDPWTWNGLIGFLNGLLLQVLLLINYTAFFFLIERGFSLRILVEIDRAPAGSLSIDDIERIYSYDYILDKRLGQMIAMDYWRKDGEYFVSTTKGRRFAAMNQRVWDLLRIGKD